MNDLYKDAELKLDTPKYKRVDESGVSQSELVLDAQGQRALIASKGWIRFLSVIGFILFSLWLLPLFFLVIPIIAHGGVAGLIVIFMIFLTVIFFMLANGLSRVAFAINRIMVEHQPVDFEMAVIAQLKFWRLFGILNLVFVFLFVLGLFVN